VMIFETAAWGRRRFGVCLLHFVSISLFWYFVLLLLLLLLPGAETSPQKSLHGLHHLCAC
jgi:hypothetical protein